MGITKDDDVKRDSQKAMLSVIRSMLIAVGSALTSYGYVDDAAVQITIGAVMTTIPIVWGLVDKYREERDAKAREVVAVNAGINVANSTVGPAPNVSPEKAQVIISTDSERKS